MRRSINRGAFLHRSCIYSIAARKLHALRVSPVPLVSADRLAHFPDAGHLDDVEVHVAYGVRYVALRPPQAVEEVAVAVTVGSAKPKEHTFA